MRDQKKRIVIAPDSFKGTMTAIEVCRIIRKAFLQVDSVLESAVCPWIRRGRDGILFICLGRKAQNCAGARPAVCHA